MKLHPSRTFLCSLLGCALATVSTAQGPRGKRGAPPPPPPAGVPTTVSGTVTQFNYDRDAEVEGFLLSNNTLVHLAPRLSSRLAESVHPGDNVQITGLAQTSPAGTQTIAAQSIQDKTSGKSLALPQPGAPAPYSGSGRIQQLNYGPDGAVSGFLLDNHTLVTMAPFAATNPSSVRVGANVAYSGYAHNTVSGRTVVDAQTLTINGQTLNVAVRGRAAASPPSAPDRAAVPPPPAPDRAAVAPPSARGRVSTPPPPPAPGLAPPSAGRTDEPPPPPDPANAPAPPAPTTQRP